MANLTITVDPETLKLARIKAIQEGTSVNKVLGTYLVAYLAAAPPDNGAARRERIEASHEQGTLVDQSAESPTEATDTELRHQRDATDQLLEMARESRASSGPDGRTWTRDDIYDRPILRRDRP